MHVYVCVCYVYVSSYMHAHMCFSGIMWTLTTGMKVLRIACRHCSTGQLVSAVSLPLGKEREREIIISKYYIGIHKARFRNTNLYLT